MVASNNKARNTNYSVGDEISYTFGNGIFYGEVTRLLEGGQAVEILFEDGRREMKKARDGSLRLLRRATGLSEAQEENKDRGKARDTDIADVMRGDIHRGSKPY